MLLSAIFRQRFQFSTTKFHCILLGTWEHFYFTAGKMPSWLNMLDQVVSAILNLINLIKLINLINLIKGYSVISVAKCCNRWVKCLLKLIISPLAFHFFPTDTLYHYWSSVLNLIFKGTSGKFCKSDISLKDWRDLSLEAMCSMRPVSLVGCSRWAQLHFHVSANRKVPWELRASTLQETLLSSTALRSSVPSVEPITESRN